MTPTDAYIFDRDDGRKEIVFGKPEHTKEYTKVKLSYAEREYILTCATEKVQEAIQ